MPANKKLVLEDGSFYLGTGFGADEPKRFEIVFNTSVVGYQEIISDPSYTYQGVVMTYPLIGNYGMCDDDYETNEPSISALIVREYCDKPSNFRCANTLSEIMKKYHIVGIEGLDTRKLNRHIRDVGSCKACIVDINEDTEKTAEELRAWIPATDAVSRVSTKEAYAFTECDDEIAKAAAGNEADSKDSENLKSCGDVDSRKTINIVAIDCGIKKNILRSMARKGMKVTVVPWNATSEEILSYKPDGVFISNGPGDPTDVDATIKAIRELIGKVPIFGICLGHQIISLAYGAKTYKLKFGHRGGNHPVKNLETGLIEITSQNHSYAVDDDSLAGTRLVKTHINLLDNTIEGVECKEDKVFSVQYHPESAPGPQDSAYLFDKFIKIIKGDK